jgi:hypothetical protein
VAAAPQGVREDGAIVAIIVSEIYLILLVFDYLRSAMVIVATISCLSLGLKFAT